MAMPTSILPQLQASCQRSLSKGGRNDRSWGQYLTMESSLGGLERFLSIGLALLGLVAAVVITYGLILLKRFGGAIKEADKKPKALPKHKVDCAGIDERWVDESGYERMLTRIHSEIQQAVAQQDRETLEIVCQGSALELFKARLQHQETDMGKDLREALQGSIRQSWDPAQQKLVVILGVSRWNKGWRRYYEEWTLQRQGNGWFVVGAKPTRLSP